MRHYREYGYNRKAKLGKFLADVYGYCRQSVNKKELSEIWKHIDALNDLIRKGNGMIDKEDKK